MSASKLKKPYTKLQSHSAFAQFLSLNYGIPNAHAHLVAKTG